MKLSSRRLVFGLGSLLIWTCFCSPSHASVDTLHINLDECVRLALTVNTEVVKARYQLKQASSYVLTSASQLLPTLGFQSTHSKYEESFLRQVGDRVIVTDESYTASLALYESFTIGGIMGTLESMEARQASSHNLRKVRQEIAYLAREKYLSVLRAKHLLEVREDALDLSKRRLEKAKAMLDVGSGVRLDVLRAQVQVSNDQMDVIAARNALRLAEAGLRHFLKLDPQLVLDLEDVSETRDLDIELEEALREASSNRADIHSAEANLRAASRQVWRERGGWFPSLTFRWSDRYTGNKFPERVSTLSDDAKWSWDLTASINLFDGFYTFSRVRNAKAAREIARQELDQFMRDAALEVRQAYYDMEEARERLDVSRKTVQLAQEELKLAEESYRLGTATMLELIDAQVSLSQAKVAHVEAVYDYILSQAKLLKAIGKDGVEG